MDCYPQDALYDPSPKTPFKVLDALDLIDDFYLNLVDWSSNVLAVGLASWVYLWSANTSKVIKLCDLQGDNVSGVAWERNGATLAVGTHKALAYAYRVTGQTMWVDRAWKELYNASDPSSAPFGEKGNNWNTAHFLDVAEFTFAFAVGYGPPYDAWTDYPKEAIRTATVTLGLQYDLEVYTNNTTYCWRQTAHGNWNYV